MKLLPFKSFAESDVINQFSLDGTGERGLFVTVSAGNFDDQHGWDTSNSVGASYDNAYSYRYKVNSTVRACATGDTKYNVLGLTLFNVAETDENGELYKFYKQKRIENSVVLSGQAVPVVGEGIFTIGTGAFETGSGDAPSVGDVLIPSSGGKVVITGYSTGIGEQRILGKVLATGSKNSNPYVVFKFTL
jgi:hypothetical protein